MTSAYIGMVNNDGSVTFIYVHGGGELDSLGLFLLNSWTNCDRINALLEQGDARYIGKDPESSFFYARDGGEDIEETKARTVNSFEEFCSLSSGECTYVFRDRNWYLRRRTEFEKLGGAVTLTH